MIWIVAVFEILLWYVQTGSWKEAFEKVIPLRKIDKETADKSTANEQMGEQEANKEQTSKQDISEQQTSKQQAVKQDTSEQQVNKDEISDQETCIAKNTEQANTQAYANE